jgi:hypothetical protein
LGIQAFNALLTGGIMEKMGLWRFLVPIIVVIFLGCTSKPEIVERKCSTCHKTSTIYAKKRTATEWKGVIHGMQIRGLKVTPEEEKAILEALVKDYGK